MPALMQIFRNVSCMVSNNYLVTELHDYTVHDEMTEMEEITSPQW